MSVNVAIDGPAGAGKSTIAKIVAKKLGYIYVDTGAMYRAMAIHMLNCAVDPSDTKKIATECENADITIKYVGGLQRVFLNGADVTEKLRTEEVGSMASVSSAVPQVRVSLTNLQRKLANENDVVMDGRDIGTVVLPDADVKIYMTASSKVRAKRRYDELVAKGEKADIDIIEKDIIERDYRDMNRETAPLKKSDDAVYLDTSDMSIDEVVAAIIDTVNK